MNIVKACSGVPEGALWFDGRFFIYADGAKFEPADDAVIELYHPRYGTELSTLGDAYGIMLDEGVEVFICLTKDLESIVHHYDITGKDLWYLLNGNFDLVNPAFHDCFSNPLAVHGVKNQMLGHKGFVPIFCNEEDMSSIIGDANGGSSLVFDYVTES